MQIPIIYEDNNIIVIDKPAGLLVHPVKLRHGASPTKEYTLAEWLTTKYPNIKNVGDSSTSSGQAPERPGIVHRLDKDTSGLMVIAKNQETFEWLKEQFSAAAKSCGGSSEARGEGGQNSHPAPEATDGHPQGEKVEKKYLALVIGKLNDKKGIITKAIGRSRKKGIKQTVAPIVPRKEAITEYRVLKEYENYSLIEATPKTGRMHQIRIHMASIGHPIACDEKYKFKRQICPKELNRQFLHANYLRFQMPDGIIKEFHSKLPEDLNKVLKNI